MKKTWLSPLLAAPLLACSGDPGSASLWNADGSTSQGGATSGGSASGDVGNPATGGVSASQGGSSTSGGGSSMGGVSGGSGITASGGSATTMGGTSAGGSVATSGGTTTGSGGTCTTDALPATVQTMLTNKCASCHGSAPLAGAPALVTYANLIAQAKSDPTKTNAQVALARVQSTTSPMPPAPGTPATAAEISGLNAWITGNYPKAACPTGSGGASGTGGASSTGGAGGTTGSDPFSLPPTCTSKATWTRGNNGSASMNPGMACVSCHQASGSEAPRFSIAGTVYATGHEPDLCNGANGNTGARVVIIGADGATVTLTPNAAGNFYSEMAVKMPYTAKVTYMGRERLMASPQTTGDCNACHNQNGTNGAPGRIVAP